MPAKSNLYLDEDIIPMNASHSVTLADSGIVVGSFHEKIVMGLCKNDKSGNLCFGLKNVIVPSCSFVNYIQVLQRGWQSLKNNSQEAFEEIIYDHNGTHFLVGKYHEWQGSFGFSLIYI